MARGRQAQEVTSDSQRDPLTVGGLPLAVLHALPDAVIVVGMNGGIRFANLAAEELFGTSAEQLCERRLGELIPADSPLFSLIDQVHAAGHSVFEHGVTLTGPRIGEHFVTIQIAPIAESGGTVVVTLRERSIAEKIDHQLTHRNAARSGTARAAGLGLTLFFARVACRAADRDPPHAFWWVWHERGRRRRQDLRVRTAQQGWCPAPPRPASIRCRSACYGSMSTPGLRMAFGSTAALAPRSAAANGSGRWRSYHGR